MRLGVLIVAALVIVVAAAVLWPSNESTPVLSSDGMQVVNGTIVGLPHQCAHCHMGYFTPWRETVNGSNVEIRPLWNPVYALQVLEGDEPAVYFESGVQRRVVREGQTVAYNFDVAENVTGIFARTHGMPSERMAQVGQQMQNHFTHYEVQLTLVSPSEQFIVDGPEDDLQLGVIVNPEPGQWQLRATLLGGEAPEAMLVFMVETLGGNVTAVLEDASDALQLNITAETRLRARPYTDHGPFEVFDWDGIDESPLLRTYWLDNHTYTPTPREEPLRDQVNLIGHYSGHLRRAFIDTGTQVGIGTDALQYFRLAQAPVRNTTQLTATLTWDPPLDLGATLRSSSGYTPFYSDAVSIVREPGRWVFEIPVAERDWDPLGANPCMNGDPNCKFYSYWDFAPGFNADTANAYDIEWQLRVES